MKKNEVKSSNLKKAIFVLLYDQFDTPDMGESFSDSSYVDYIINALIEKNKNRCPFKCYDCIGHCKNNTIGCVEGLTADCTKEIEEIWKDFIGIENDKD
ncbi:hypothetical protein AL714_07675 [Clostridium botulinum]|uniref:hypothetical protein n=1 Tax=Clostridium botulinum TaxID=1491 RepID=UPI00099E11C7|nr:hypothetical protein [Clostridium botulinum]MCC5439512.1 hypothetical protein [Clostridium botulinum]NFR57643.1 hypothetical protein [Clostridium botulinum]OPD37568.1 hypothetical protein AL714_07675 [Clostridium botulinum]